ncbi:helix-turn-helix domain-containing protein [Gracilibacillus marinus]|uniref:Helix-turn-helix domain-containing protein n=1 Tax=Gracilibacillus marinus TaxID=630535 RepID=A0ABV8VX04_9BACI
MTVPMKLKSSGEIFDKTKLASATSDTLYVKLPSGLFNYVHVPGYKPEYSHLYSIIVDFYNVNYGYAFPTEWQIAKVYGKSIKTVRNHLRQLERLGLILIIKNSRNKMYVPLKPLTKEQLFIECPEAERRLLEIEEAEKQEYEREFIPREVIEEIAKQKAEI